MTSLRNHHCLCVCVCGVLVGGRGLVAGAGGPVFAVSRSPGRAATGLVPARWLPPPLV